MGICNDTRIFSNLQELWDYCDFCPVCQKTGRHPVVLFGPDINFTTNNISKQEEYLHIQTRYKWDEDNDFDLGCNVDFTINCLDNTFGVHAYDQKGSITPVPQNEPYIYLSVSCETCQEANVSSEDIELDLETRTLSPIKLERETMVLNEWFVIIQHGKNCMLVFGPEPDDIVSRLTEVGKPVRLPIIDFDWADKQKTLDKLKTYVLFA